VFAIWAIFISFCFDARLEMRLNSSHMNFNSRRSISLAAYRNSQVKDTGTDYDHEPVDVTARVSSLFLFSLQMSLTYNNYYKILSPKGLV
jgi:hypothetical protein